MSNDEETPFDADSVRRSCSLIDDNPTRAAVVLTVSELRDLADAARRGIAAGRAQSPSNGSNGSTTYLATIAKLEAELAQATKGVLRLQAARAVAENAWADEARALRAAHAQLRVRLNAIYAAVNGEEEAAPTEAASTPPGSHRIVLADGSVVLTHHAQEWVAAVDSALQGRRR